MKHSYEIKADLNAGTFQYTEILNDQKIASGTLGLDWLPAYTGYLTRVGAMGTIEF